MWFRNRLYIYQNFGGISNSTADILCVFSTWHRKLEIEFFQILTRCKNSRTFLSRANIIQVLTVVSSASLLIHGWLPVYCDPQYVLSQAKRATIGWNNFCRNKKIITKEIILRHRHICVMVEKGFRRKMMWLTGFF